jgi:arginyl-tRNA synthetase
MFLEGIQQQIATHYAQRMGLAIEPQFLELANPRFGAHLALPCFRFAAELGKNPQEIAIEFAAGDIPGVCDRVEATGGYINFWIRSQALLEMVADTRLVDNAASNKKVIVEFLSPNLAKPLSIGHLRNALQGRFLANLYRAQGFEVITDNHIGDWGTVFGMWVVGYQRFSSDELLSKDGVKELGRIYVAVRQALKDSNDDEKQDLENEIQSWLLRLEQSDPEALAYHSKFSQISLDDVNAQMKRLDVVFDYNLGESFYVARGKEMVHELLESGIARRNDDGSVIIPLDDKGIDTPMLIEKSNGAALYATSDIATVEYREKTWQPEEVVYVVGAEQQHHFKQLFAANERAGWSDARLIHHWYGLVEEVDESGNRQKMSSREKAVFMSDLLDHAEAKARAIAPDTLSDQDVSRIAYGAVTFREFSSSHTGNVVFDWDAMFSLSGFSGPYVQYAAVRMAAVISKSDETKATIPLADYDYTPHVELLWTMAQFELAQREAYEMREGHRLAAYAYELARAWNRFYETTPILSDNLKERSARLWLAAACKDRLVRTLDLLGIAVPAHM